jgi:stage V sporulation protein AA
MNPTIYLRLRKRIQMDPGQRLSIKDVCHMVGDIPIEEIGKLPVYTTSLKNGNFTVIDVLEVVRIINKSNPSLNIRNIGPLQTVIEIRTKDLIPKKLLVAIVWIFLFIGSGLAIMHFHIDVNMKEVHKRMYYLITGQHTLQPVVLQVSYSLGIGIGMILFFNHLFKRRFNEEPSPMELEMFLYQETIDQYVIHHEKQRKKHDPSV